MNATELSIKKSELIQNGHSFPIKSVIKYQENLILKFDQQLIGDAVLQIEFLGRLNDKMKGFYRSKYCTPAGKERYAAVTQFAATDARRCFPCW